MDIRNTYNRFAPRVATTVAAGAFLASVYMFNRKGKFIPEKDFIRMLTSDDVLVLVTPLGDFRVTPVR